LRQLVGEVGGQQVAARRERLAELDEDGAQGLERAPQPHSARLGQRTIEEERTDRARSRALGCERELLQPEAQGYPQDLDETEQGNRARVRRSGKSTRIVPRTPKPRNQRLPGDSSCSMRFSSRAVSSRSVSTSR